MRGVRVSRLRVQLRANREKGWLRFCPTASIRAMRAFPRALAAAIASASLPAASLLGQVVSPSRVAASSPAAQATRQISAHEVREPIIIDGLLDEPAWRNVEPARGFIQSEPRTGQPATEDTEVRVLYDANTLYIGAYLHDREPNRLVVNDIRKDFREDDQDDFEVLLDTFHDRRNGYVFITNAEGARADRQVANEGREVNTSWDAIWTVRSRRVSDGWTVEMAIPFRSLRYDAASVSTWGINFARRIRRKNEVDFWSPVPREYNLTRVSLAGDLVGLVHDRTSNDLRVKPYVAARTVRTVGGASFDRAADAGVDLKYGVTKGLALDITVNPDFAQVEADEQQVNLTQFSQFFPEKREFFLENSGIFYVGDAARNNRQFAPPTPDEDLLLFFSRRIGLTPTGQPIPIPAGVRLTGQLGGFTVGALSMQTRTSAAAEGSNYSVLRMRRNLLTGSDIGFLVMNRLSSANTGNWNRVVGGDANIRFFGRLDWNSYLMASRSPGKDAGQYAGRTSLNYESKFFHGKAGVLQIGEGFADDMGFLRRTNTRKYILDTGLRPRFAGLQRLGIREMHPHVTWNYYDDLQGRMIGKNLHTGYSLFFNDGGFVEFSVNPKFELIAKPFMINPDIAPIPAGNYPWTEYMFKGQTDASRPVSLTYTLISGGLWSGTQRTQQVSVAVRPSFRLGATEGVSHTEAYLDAPRAKFEALLWTTRVNYSFTTNMFIDALSQYDPRQRMFNANVRFNVIHHPLSDLFIVFNEQRMTAPDAPVPGRGVILKFTQMMSF